MVNLHVNGGNMAKVIQTELDEMAYRRFKEFSKSRGASIKETLRDAAMFYLEEKTSPENDPIFSVKPRRTGVKTDASKLDEQLYSEKP